MPEMNGTASKALIIHTAAIGDCILALPLVRFLKIACRLNAIHFWTRQEIAHLFTGRTDIDYAVAAERFGLHRLFITKNDFDLRAEEKQIATLSEFDHVLSFVADADSDFHHNLSLLVYASRSAHITALPTRPLKDWPPQPFSSFLVRQFAEQNNLPYTPLTLDATWLTPLPQDFQKASALLSSVKLPSDKPLAILHPGSGGQAKCWHIQHFIEVAKILRQRQMKILFILGPAEQERWPPSTIEKLAAVGSMLFPSDLINAFAILTAADLYIGNDSGISHLAGAMGKRTFVVFGPTDPGIWKPNGPQVYVYQPPLKSFTTYIPECVKPLVDQIDTILLKHQRNNLL